MIKTYKYKLRPTMKQQKNLSQFFGCARYVYNWGLNQKVTAYEKNKKSIGYIQLAKELTILKQQEETKWLNNCPNVCMQQSLRNLDNAFTRFFREKKGFPKFKSKKRSRDCVKFIDSVHFDFVNWKVKAPKLGWIKMCMNKPFDQSECKQGTLTISRDNIGEYWCTIVVDDNKPNVSKAKIQEDTSVGIDLGIKDFAIMSDGTKYGNPKFLEKHQKQLSHLQKRFAMTQKGSNRHEVMRIKVAKCHKKISNRRNDFLHKLSTMLIKEYDTICLENLNVEGMLKNHCLAKSISSVSWSEFVRQLQYKAEWHGKNLVFIGRFEPSSKTCSECGYINSELKLSDREWICPRCGTHHDRDVNAAMNIKQMALHPQNLVGVGHLE